MTPPSPPVLFLLHLLLLNGPNHPRVAERTQGEVHSSLHLHSALGDGLALCSGHRLTFSKTGTWLSMLLFPDNSFPKAQQLRKTASNLWEGTKAQSLHCHPLPLIQPKSDKSALA